MPDENGHLAFIVDTSRSPHARLRPAPLNAVRLDDIFWSPRLETNHEVTLPSQLRQLESTGAIDNFRRASGKKQMDFQGFFYSDSDVYKWLEAAAWTLAANKDPALAQVTGDVIAVIADAQQADGYLNTFFMFEKAAERWSNLFVMHELYCAGHLIQAAVAHRRATGSDRLLTVARRLADLICDMFGPAESGKKPGADGHPEIEMALAELYRTTGEAKYLEQARYFLDVRGQGLLGKADVFQDHLPFRKLRRMTGHAVRALYLNIGATDLYTETGEPALREALDALWGNMTGRQMYISGGVGSQASQEAFGNDYDLPNATSYAETCAAIASVMWNWRMLQLEGDARYADVMETTLYNSALVGVALDGEHYFYANRLADDGLHHRQPWFETACCPTNMVRLLASLPAYFYSLSDQGIWVHLYATGAASLTLPDGLAVTLKQETHYPWEGDVVIKVEAEGEFGLYVRIPEWCSAGAELVIDGQPFGGEVLPGTYAEIRRAWRSGDTLHLTLPMSVRRVESNPHVAENIGRVALMRGPILYCVERVDHPDLDLDAIVLTKDMILASAFRPNLLGGIVTLEGEAGIMPPDEAWGDELYREARPRPEIGPEQIATLTAIPYYAWANREPGSMRVWLRTW